MKRWIWTSLAAVAAVGIAACGARMGELKVDEVSAMLGKPGVYVYDANNQARFDKEHVPGAVHVSAKTLSEADLPAEKKEATLIFYCANEG